MGKLTGQSVSSSYDQLLIVDNASGISGSLQAIESADTGGSSSSLKISTSKCEVIPASNSTSLFEVSQADGTAVLSVDTTNALIGIGTAAPDMPLEINHADTTAITGANIASNAVVGLHIDHTADTDTAGSVIKLSSNSDGCQSAIAHIQVDNDDADLAFYTDNAGTLTEAMRIDNSQLIGIGTDTPTSIVHVKGSSSSAHGDENLAANDPSVTFQIQNSDTTDNNYSQLAFVQQSLGAGRPNLITASIAGKQQAHGNNVEHGSLNFHCMYGGTIENRMKIDSDGAVYMYDVYADDIGSERDLLIQADGQLGHDGSSKVFKTNIQPIGDISWLYQLNPVTFHRREKDEDGNFINKPNLDKGRQHGLIAEEVWVLQPDLCHKATAKEKAELNLETEAISVKYKNIVPALIKAVQELSAKVTALENA